MSLFARAVRPVLFRLGGGDAETAHEWTLHRLASMPPAAREVLRRRYAFSAPVEAFGVRFPNRVGLAAGMDKNGLALPAWSALGFGFVEVGTVTAKAQPGNDKPRLFRLRESEAIINRMGFNNAGAAALADRLARLGPIGVPLGVSLGKSKVTPLEDAVEDYLESYRLLHPYADYIAVNVSSPNTPGLRALQDRDSIEALLTALRGPVPVLVKIAPDLSEPAIAELLEVCLEHGAAGLIATNTTLARDGLVPGEKHLAAETGGLSGKPLTERARAVVRFVHDETGGRLPIIGVGGIMSADDASRMLDAGATLVQLYSGFIYKGPDLVRAVAQGARPARSPAVR
ncbi:quinone-dependent dihydroorotate dehydrogenase [Actinoplanes teichomyceticus]|uniref:Dihydroorotate dehydrogenase (quinone) n=1 Tax=Actinoplanes teichomyceticus TaxID=1867 RepID=A0A561VRB9_ACTTI|nr:quinone-dependent dihydroorotate dehydrogenase [Actinoplanes teichomyceticus]TWG14156.1 dihydroorotate oxidase A [Actinoplanes teichomyceticus]GIF13284.1 dihydroorotate dehydrogenase (quinone) [Actinoplanes teichomyceticus]